MKDDKEIAALVSLLDDPDINIYNLVKSQLINVGNDCIPFLEKANFENDYDEVYQSRIKGITHEIRLNEILSKHKEWIDHPVNLIDGVNQIDQYFFPNITRHYVDNEIKNIVKEISNLLTEQMSALEKVSIINDVMILPKLLDFLEDLMGSFVIASERIFRLLYNSSSTI